MKIKELLSRVFKKDKYIEKGFNNLIKVPNFRKGRIKIHGNNNTIEIDDTVKFIGNIQIYGNNNKIYIQSGCFINSSITIGSHISRTSNDCSLEIGQDLYCGKSNILMLEHNSIIKIGNDCMFSDNIDIFCSDGHSITDYNGNIINIGKKIEIGNHVWIGKDVKIGKNTKISNNSIVGWASVITKSFEQENVIIASNPAKIIKEHINWHRDCPNDYSKID